MVERIHLETSDGLTLEARIDSLENPRWVTVFCHPHPQHGGSMNAPLMISVTQQLVRRGHRVIRFNFRGTGASEGEHEFGTAETLDVQAAVDRAATSDLPIGIAGWSFGAGVGLRWLAEQWSSTPYVGIAPAPPLLPEKLPQSSKRIILGTREQVIDAAALETYAAEQGIDLVKTPGDHFFHGRGSRIGDLVGQGLEDGW